MLAIFPIGLPLVAGLALQKLKPHLNPVGESGQIDMDNPTLAVSPFKTLVSGIKPQYASFYPVVDMLRR